MQKIKQWAKSDNFIFLGNESNIGSVFDRGVGVDVDAVIDADAAESLAAVEGHRHWEEIVWVAADAELHAAAGVGRVDDRVLPEQRTAPRVMRVLTLALGHVGGTHTVRDGDADDDVVELELGVLEGELDVDVAAPGSVLAWPAVDGQGDRGLVLGLEAPLEHSDTGVQRERLGRVLEAYDGAGPEELLVDVGMGLELNILVVGVLEAQLDAAAVFVRDPEGHQTEDLHVLEAAVAASGQADLLLDVDADGLGADDRGPGRLANDGAWRGDHALPLADQLIHEAVHVPGLSAQFHGLVFLPHGGVVGGLRRLGGCALHGAGVVAALAAVAAAAHASHR